MSSDSSRHDGKGRQLQGREGEQETNQRAGCEDKPPVEAVVASVARAHTMRRPRPPAVAVLAHGACGCGMASTTSMALQPPKRVPGRSHSVTLEASSDLSNCARKGRAAAPVGQLERAACSAGRRLRGKTNSQKIISMYIQYIIYIYIYIYIYISEIEDLSCLTFDINLFHTVKRWGCYLARSL